MPESWDPADSLFLAVSFHHTHTLTHTQREKGEEGKRKKKKRQEHLASWCGSGFAECGESRISKGEGRAGWLPHSCLAGQGCSTHGWHYGHRLEPFGGSKHLIFWSWEGFEPLGRNLKPSTLNLLSSVFKTRSISEERGGGKGSAPPCHKRWGLFGSPRCPVLSPSPPGIAAEAPRTVLAAELLAAPGAD